MVRAVAHVLQEEVDKLASLEKKLMKVIKSKGKAGETSLQDSKMRQAQNILDHGRMIVNSSALRKDFDFDRSSRTCCVDRGM